MIARPGCEEAGRSAACAALSCGQAQRCGEPGAAQDGAALLPAPLCLVLQEIKQRPVGACVTWRVLEEPLAGNKPVCGNISLLLLLGPSLALHQQRGTGTAGAGGDALGMTP